MRHSRFCRATGVFLILLAPWLVATRLPAQEPSEAGPPEARADDGLEYRISIGDLVAIEVFGLSEFDRDVRVGLDGTIDLPLLGEVPILDLTAREAEKKLESLLSERQLVNRPEVTITVEEFTGRGVSVQGAVAKPGNYQLFGPKTLLEVLVEAGGLSAQSGGTNIFVFRRQPDGSQVRTRVDAERLVEQGDLSLNMDLRPGDIVLVPQPRRLKVYVSGAVSAPGPVEYLSSEGITLLQAITAAGGATERANLGKVQVIRKLDDGTEERFLINVKKIRKGKLEDFVLQRNDTIVVKQWFF